MKRVAKILGADVELGNVLQSASGNVISNDSAARLLLAEIDGIPGYRTPASSAPFVYYGHGASASSGYTGTTRGYEAQDWGRKFLATTGGCFYIDLGHLEACIPEVCSARDFVAAHHANLRLACAACRRANQKLAPGERIVVMANNTDRLGQSWGGHLNVLVSRDLWTRIFDHMYPTLFVLAAFQVSSILYTGQGKVGAENGKEWVDFQITQRGDFFECLAGEQTTYRRPICNMRDEAHVGKGATASDLARLHVIFHDTTLTEGSNYLKAGVTQLLLAMLESGWCDTQVLLAEPLAALSAWGHDPQLHALASLADGRQVTAVEHQELFALAARRFVETGEAQQVPEADRILALWEDTLAKLARRDFTSLARRLDWVMKRGLLERLIDRNPGLDWHSNAVRAADLMFASLDPTEGVYWAIEKAGGVDRIVSNGEIRRFTRNPPLDTRAWSRTMLLRQVGRHAIESVNWDEIRLSPHTPGAAGTLIRLDDPRRFTRAEMLGRSEHDMTSSQVSVAETITNPSEKGLPT